jgi:hypothetical protein
VPGIEHRLPLVRRPVVPFSARHDAIAASHGGSRRIFAVSLSAEASIISSA